MNINIAAAQYPISEHHDFAAWAKHTERWVQRAMQQNAQLLLFPEYGSMELVSIFPEHIKADLHTQVNVLDTLKDDFCTVFAELAQKYHIGIVAPSLPVLHHQKPVNRAFVFSPKGLVGYQDKFFMTRFENESWGISSGVKQLSVFEADWGKFGIQICYDVEFPIGSQLLAQAGAHVILAPSCTETIRGATRVHIGARARALENQCYTVVSQTVGEALWSPAVDINYGYAGFYATPDKNLPEEGIVATMQAQKADWLVTNLDLRLLETVRTDGQVFNYKDQYQVTTRLLTENISHVSVAM